MFTRKRLILIIILAVVIVAAPVSSTFLRGESGTSEGQMQVISLWQIDSFEGGKGSRAQFLQDTADKLYGGNNTYFTVTSISADAARKNFEQGIFPDIISYGAGFYGIEGLINGTDFACKVWCRGGYCLLTLDNQSDFSDVTPQNTVINVGKDNLTSVCAILEGLSGADEEKSTGAYVELLGGKYKYLLGTQRDIFRLRTRGVAFKVKPVTCFNDLYQCVSILAKDKKYAVCKEFVEYLTDGIADVSAVGLFRDGQKLYQDELSALENLDFDCTLKSFVSESYVNKLTSAANSGDLNLVKSLLK
ncbi:MAG: hypothetical protein ACI4MH_03250 [Candidatus Coproplasma sp.]